MLSWCKGAIPEYFDMRDPGFKPPSALPESPEQVVSVRRGACIENIPSLLLFFSFFGKEKENQRKEDLLEP